MWSSEVEGALVEQEGKWKGVWWSGVEWKNI